MRIERVAASLAVSLLLWTEPARGQGWFPPDSVIAENLRGLVSNHQVAGVVVGMLDADGTRRVIAHGSSGRAGLMLDGSTVFEIGSITKAFTGTLFADMVRRGEVQLTDPLTKLLPANVRAPARNGKPITLLDLSTHYSGLPSMPADLEPSNPENPYADFTLGHLYGFLSGYELTRDPGEAFDYSNLGTGLLGHLLSLRGGMSYEALLRARVLETLGMSSTAITLTPAMARRLAQGHKTFGDTASNWDLPTLAGAGALRSTADDMLRFAAANLATATNVKRDGLAASLQGALTPRRFIPGEGGAVGRDSVALNWIINASPASRRLVWHNGGTGGYTSVLLLDLESKRAVVVLANTEDALRSIQPLAFRLLDPEVPLSKPRLGPLVAASYRAGGIAAAITTYRSARLTPDRFEFNEDDLNRVGYWLIRRQRLLDDAVAIFRVNVESYPEEPNTYDSLGEALVETGRLQEARDAYAKAVALAEKFKSPDVAEYQKNLERVTRQLQTSR